MSTTPRYIPRYTIDDYNHWEGDWELIDGVPISMSPSPFGPHERVISRLSYQIQSQLQTCVGPCVIYTNLDWIIDNHTVIRPDLMVVCGEQPQRHLERPPVLMAEVLSESTRGRDLTAKRTLCRENNVAHYLVIDPEQRTMLHVTESGEIEINATESQLLTLENDCQISIQSGSLFD